MSINASNVIADHTDDSQADISARAMFASSGRNRSPTVFFGRILGVRGGRCGLVLAFFGRGLTLRVRCMMRPSGPCACFFGRFGVSAVVRRRASRRLRLTTIGSARWAAPMWSEEPQPNP